MKFDQLNMEIECKKLSVKQSRLINEKLRKFAQQYSGETQLTDDVAAEFLTVLTFDILYDIYNKLAKSPSQTIEYDLFENSVSLEEVMMFLREQVNTNGSQDFLLQPLNAILQSMERVGETVTSLVNKEIDKISL